MSAHRDHRAINHLATLFAPRMRIKTRTTRICASATAKRVTA